SLPAQTGQASGLVAQHRFAQTFLTWKEGTGTPAPDSYHVYRASSQILTPADLANANLVAAVAKGSWFNPRAKRAYLLKDNGTPLKAGEGFLVVTPAAAGRSYYAVVAVTNSKENTAINSSAGGNSSGAVLEALGSPKPVLQLKADGGKSLFYVHFATPVDLQGQLAMTNREGRVFDYWISYDPLTAGPRPVVIIMHPLGGSFLIPRIPWLPANAIQVNLDDTNPPGNQSLWFGHHQDYAKGPPAGKVHDYTERRILWTLKQVLADTSLNPDANRVYAFGLSLGAIGAVGLGVRHPDKFAAVAGISPAFDLQHSDFSLVKEVDDIFGTAAQNLLTSLGPKVYDLHDYPVQLSLLEKVGVAPMLFTMGRADLVTGWTEKPKYFLAARKHRQPGSFYWDLRTHAGIGPWSLIESRLFAELMKVRLDLPYPVLTNLSLDDDPGDGNPLNGTIVGTIGGYATFDPTTPSETATLVKVDVGLKSDPSRLDYATSPTATADLTLRRLRSFAVTAGTYYDVRTRARGKTLIEEERIIVPDAQGLLTVRRLGLSRATLRTVEFSPRTVTTPELVFGGDRRLGGMLRMYLLAPKGQAAFLMLGTKETSVVTQWGIWRIQDVFPMWGGLVPPDGLVELPLPIPGALYLRGLQLLGQGLGGTKLSPLARVTLR
ncbi:MAG: hypothetical protein ACE5F1_05450, partial [Planctomycetota bacterium]